MEQSSSFSPGIYNQFLLRKAVNSSLQTHIVIHLLLSFLHADLNDSDRHQSIRSSSIWHSATCLRRSFTPWVLILISTDAGHSVAWAANFTQWELLASDWFPF